MFYIKSYFLYNFLITHYKKVLKGGSYFENNKESWNNLVDNIIFFIIKNESIGGFINEKQC